MSTADAAGIRVVLACDFFLRYTSRLAGGLRRGGVDVAMVTRDHDLEFGGRLGAASAFVAVAAGPAVRQHVIPGRVRSRHGAAATIRVRRAVHQFDPDVVHLQASIANDIRLILASGAHRHRFALTVHDPVRHPGEAVSLPARLGNRALIREAGLLFVHAQALREELIDVASPRAPIVVIPHGVDPGERQPLPERPAVLFFGRIGHYKGVDVLLDAMPSVWARVPEARLILAGAGDLQKHPTLEDPRAVVRLEHVPDDDVPELLSSATCVALPYRQASQSGVGTLAKRYARPLVLTAVGGLPELVADGSGIVVPPDDPQPLADALVSVLQDRALAERLGGAGAETATQGASWETVGELTLAAYREHLLGSGDGRSVSGPRPQHARGR
jgi:glycosyltransferase involved in cell wall biosynthesis